MFTLVVYAQLVLENAAIYADEGVDGDLVDQIFDVLVRDFSRQALELHVKPACTALQMDYALKMLRRPVADGTTAAVWPKIPSSRSHRFTPEGRHRLPFPPRSNWC